MLHTKLKATVTPREDNKKKMMDFEPLFLAYKVKVIREAFVKG